MGRARTAPSITVTTWGPAATTGDPADRRPQVASVCAEAAHDGQSGRAERLGARCRSADTRSTDHRRPSTGVARTSRYAFLDLPVRSPTLRRRAQGCRAPAAHTLRRYRAHVAPARRRRRRHPRRRSPHRRRAGWPGRNHLLPAHGAARAAPWCLGPRRPRVPDLRRRPRPDRRAGPARRPPQPAAQRAAALDRVDRRHPGQHRRQRRGRPEQPDRPGHLRLVGNRPARRRQDAGPPLRAHHHDGGDAAAARHRRPLNGHTPTHRGATRRRCGATPAAHPTRGATQRRHHDGPRPAAAPHPRRRRTACPHQPRRLRPLVHHLGRHPPPARRHPRHRPHPRGVAAHPAVHPRRRRSRPPHPATRPASSRTRAGAAAVPRRRHRQARPAGSAPARPDSDPHRRPHLSTPPSHRRVRATPRPPAHRPPCPHPPTPAPTAPPKPPPRTRLTGPPRPPRRPRPGRAPNRVVMLRRTSPVADPADGEAKWHYRVGSWSADTGGAYTTRTAARTGPGSTPCIAGPDGASMPHRGKVAILARRPSTPNHPARPGRGAQPPNTRPWLRNNPRLVPQLSREDHRCGCSTSTTTPTATTSPGCARTWPAGHCRCCGSRYAPPAPTATRPAPRSSPTPTTTPPTPPGWCGPSTPPCPPWSDPDAGWTAAAPRSSWSPTPAPTW